MLLDNHCIVIRERSYLELLDLALRVGRAHAGRLTVAFLVGIGPFVLLNAWLLSRWARDIDLDGPLAYVWFTLWLVVFEMPLATAPATLYLGQVLFTDRPAPKKIAANFFGSLPQMLLYQVLVRAILVLPVITWPLIFAVRPYLSEVILLERNPLRAKDKNGATTGRRLSTLHRGLGGDMFVAWLANMLFGVTLFAAFWFTAMLVMWLLVEAPLWKGATYTVLYPLALWLVVAYFTVVRFLGYLDVRIRREGWEVELLLRAEQARLTRQWT